MDFGNEYSKSRYKRCSDSCSRWNYYNYGGSAIGSYSAECVTVETTEIKFSVQTLVAKGTAKATVNSDNVVLTLTDEDEKSYDIPKISSNKY